MAEVESRFGHYFGLGFGQHLPKSTAFWPTAAGLPCLWADSGECWAEAGELALSARFWPIWAESGQCSAQTLKPRRERKESWTEGYFETSRSLRYPSAANKFEVSRVLAVPSDPETTSMTDAQEGRVVARSPCDASCSRFVQQAFASARRVALILGVSGGPAPRRSPYTRSSRGSSEKAGQKSEAGVVQNTRGAGCGLAELGSGPELLGATSALLSMSRSRIRCVAEQVLSEPELLGISKSGSATSKNVGCTDSLVQRDEPCEAESGHIFSGDRPRAVFPKIALGAPPPPLDLRPTLSSTS